MSEKRPQLELHIRYQSKTLWGWSVSRHFPKLCLTICTVCFAQEPDWAREQSITNEMKARAELGADGPRPVELLPGAAPVDANGISGVRTETPPSRD